MRKIHRSAGDSGEPKRCTTQVYVRQPAQVYHAGGSGAAKQNTGATAPATEGRNV